MDYSLDLIRAAGARYLRVDGNLTQHLIGQDRPVGRRVYRSVLESADGRAAGEL
ncbi:MAG TPA: hypothetical protein VKM54_08260 [Myxococcota bacterium]|nr:hypothetical protein [Myxococcota bacterium]